MRDNKKIYQRCYLGEQKGYRYLRPPHIIILIRFFLSLFQNQFVRNLCGRRSQKHHFIERVYKNKTYTPVAAVLPDERGRIKVEVIQREVAPDV
jgi:hypothetical protein